MAESDWARFTRRDGRPLTVRKDAVAAFAPTRSDEEQTFLYLMGRGSDDGVVVDETPEDVARALDAA